MKKSILASFALICAMTSAPAQNQSLMFRAYAPTKTFFDKAWKLPDVEKVN